MGGSLSEAVGRLADIRLEVVTAREVFDLVVHAAASVVPGAEGAALALPGTGTAAKALAPVTVSHERYLGLRCEGSPADDAISSCTQLHTGDDLARWPAFAKAASHLGICDVIATPFLLRADRHGCLSVYSSSRSFDQQATAAVEALARHATGLLANAVAFEELRRANEQLNEGLRSREIIGLAKGILMRQERCSEADAFRILVSGSQRLNRKVRDVARDVIALTEGRSELTRGRHD